MFEYSYADVQAQVANLPLAFRIWFQWMFFAIVLSPIFFVRHRQGRVALLFSATFLALHFPLMLSVGPTNLLSRSCACGASSRARPSASGRSS